MPIFPTYEYIPTSYAPNNLVEEALDLRIKKKPLEVYDRQGNVVGYSWYYGDAIVLEFTTTGNVILDDDYYQDAVTYLKDKKLRLQFLDFRYNIVYDFIQPASAVAKFFITNTASKDFVRGTYRCKLTLVDDHDEEHVVNCTLIDVDDFTFSVM